MKLFGFDITRSGREQRGVTQDLLDARIAGLQGGNVTPKTAMGVTAVWSCVNLVAKTVAILPMSAMLRGDENTRYSAESHPLHRILAVRPNNYQTPVVFLMQMVAHLLLWGNFFAETQFDRITGEALGLYPIHPSQVDVVLVKGRKSFRIGGKVFTDEQIFHLMGHSIDGIRGVSPIAVHRSTISLSAEAVKYAENFYLNGTKLSGYLKHPGKLGPEGVSNLSKSWSDAYSGAGNAGKVAITAEGVEFKALTMPMADAQFVEIAKLQIGEAARIFGIPLHKLAEMDGAKFNNVEAQNTSFVIDVIQPIVTAFEQEANWKLILPEERGRLYTHFNLNAYLRGDLKTRMAAYAIMRQWALATINEIRALEDMNPIDGGDELFAGGNGQASAAANIGHNGGPPLDDPNQEGLQDANANQ
jgi:HK97 family phage portal protein